MKRKRQELDETPSRMTTRQHSKSISSENEEEIIKNEVEQSHFETGEQLSEYEKKRLENIRKNQEMMRSLNFEQIKNEQRILKDSNRNKSTDIVYTPKIKEKASLLPTRRSLRISGRGAELQTQFYTPVIEAAPEVERKPSGPIDIVPVNDIEQEDSQTFLKKLCPVESCKSKVKDEDDLFLAESASTQKYREMMSKLKVLPKNVAKVVPNRVCSMAFHPSAMKPILCVGDKGGYVGFWDLEAKRKDNNGIFIYEPHCGHVTSLSFHPKKNNNLYSSSYDGTVRCADFNTCIFNEVYCSKDYISISGLSYPCSSHDVIILSHSDGQVAIVDTRQKQSKNSLYLCHQRAVKSVHCSPTNPNIFCTSSADASVALWDIRHLKNINSKLDSVLHGRTVSSAYFSPVTGRQILTTSLDDYVKVFELTDSDKIEIKRSFKHFNHTGRWLTPFKATWDPKNNCGFVVGSMLSARRVQIYHSEQNGISPIVELFDENYGTITSINVFHNIRNILACGNSSGKVYVWTEKHE